MTTDGGNGRVISLRNVGVYYWLKKGYLRRERFWALEDVSLDLHRGESLGVIGRNGAGKTTLLQILAGIIAPDRGRMENSGVRAAMLSVQIGFLDQLDGKENAIMSGLMLGLTKKEVEARLEAIRDFSELGAFFDRPIGTYSSGMKARLGLAVALQLDPDVLLIDEVLGVGDAEFRAKSETAMRERVHSERTIVMVSHNPVTIRQLCDRAVWIEQGRSLAEGPTDEVLQKYEDCIQSENKN